MRNRRRRSRPVVADDHRLFHTDIVQQAGEVCGEVGDVVGLDPFGSARTTVSALVGGEDVIAGRGEFGNLVPLGVRELRKSVGQQDDRRPGIPGLGQPQRHTVGVDQALMTAIHPLNQPQPDGRCRQPARPSAPDPSGRRAGPGGRQVASAWTPLSEYARARSGDRAATPAEYLRAAVGARPAPCTTDNPSAKSLARGRTRRAHLIAWLGEDESVSGAGSQQSRTIQMKNRHRRIQ